MCMRCGRLDGDEQMQMLMCDGFRCSVAQHTSCCESPVHHIPPGKWFCEGCAFKHLGTMRQKLQQALSVSRQSHNKACWRVPLDERPTTAETHGSAECSVDADGVRELRLAVLAPSMDFDYTVQQGTIYNHEGNRIAGALYAEESGYAVEGTELRAHPDPRTLSKTDKMPARVLTEANVDVDLIAPFIMPPAQGKQSAWRVLNAVANSGADAVMAQAYVCKVLYIPLHEAVNGEGSSSCAADLRSLSAAAIRAVARAIDAGQYTADEKTGGGYVVAGNGCMATAPPPPVVYATHPGRSKSSHIIPYTRVNTYKALVSEAVACVAPVMGCVAEAIGKVFPETTSGLAAATRHCPVVGDTFMFPAHEAQRLGLPMNNSDAGSICVHQLAMRLAGALRTTEKLCKRSASRTI